MILDLTTVGYRYTSYELAVIDAKSSSLSQCYRKISKVLQLLIKILVVTLVTWRLSSTWRGLDVWRWSS